MRPVCPPFAWQGCQGKLRKVVSNTCVAQTYLDQKVKIKAESRAERWFLSKRDVFFCEKIMDKRSINLNYSAGATCLI